MRHRLRVLIANQRADRLALLAGVVTGLGHEVTGREIHVSEVAAVTARERPDVALVGLGENPEHALQLISEIVKGSFCPVIALLDAYDSGWLTQAAKLGISAYLVDERPEELQSVLDIALCRYGEFQRMQGAFERRDREADRESDLHKTQKREALELHDGVVQSLSAGLLALELDRHDDTQQALLEALDSARGIVSRSLADLRQQGVPLHQLIRDAAATR